MANHTCKNVSQLYFVELVENKVRGSAISTKSNVGVYTSQVRNPL